MTWNTQLGHRHAVGAEAELIREAIAFIRDSIELELTDPEIRWPFQVPVFDKLDPRSRLGLLAEVGEALLAETEPLPLTAITEGAVAAIYDAIRQLVAIEIDEQNSEAETGTRAPSRYRELALKIAKSDEPRHDAPAEADPDPDDALPSPRSTDCSSWDCVLQAISDRFLWDDDFLDARRAPRCREADAATARNHAQILSR